MEGEYSPEILIWVTQSYHRFADFLGFLLYLGVAITSGAAIIGATSFYCILTGKVSSLEWVENTALVVGIVSIPYCLVQTIAAAYIIFLETSIGGFFGSGTSPQVHFIPSVLIHVFPLIGLAYLNRKVRASCFALLILSLVYVIQEPILRRIADAS